MSYKLEGWNTDISKSQRLECSNCHNKFNTLNCYVDSETNETITLCDNCKKEIISK